MWKTRGMGEWERRNLPQTQFNYLVVAQKSASQRQGGSRNNVPANVIFPCHHIEVFMYDVRNFLVFVPIRHQNPLTVYPLI